MQGLIDGTGLIPAELEHVALCDRMGMNWHELMATPESVVDDYRVFLAAENEAAEIRNRWSNRGEY